MFEKENIIKTIKKQFEKNNCKNYKIMNPFLNATEKDVTFGKKVKIAWFKCSGTGMLTAEKENFKAFTGYTGGVTTKTTLSLGCSFIYKYKKVVEEGKASERLLKYLDASPIASYGGGAEATFACKRAAEHVAYEHNAKCKGSNVISTQTLQKEIYIPDVYEAFMFNRYVGMMDNGIFKISQSLIDDAMYTEAHIKRNKIIFIILGVIALAFLITIFVIVGIERAAGK